MQSVLKRQTQANAGFFQTRASFNITEVSNNEAVKRNVTLAKAGATHNLAVLALAKRCSASRKFHVGPVSVEDCTVTGSQTPNQTVFSFSLLAH